MMKSEQIIPFRRILSETLPEPAEDVDVRTDATADYALGEGFALRVLGEGMALQPELPLHDLLSELE